MTPNAGTPQRVVTYREVLAIGEFRAMYVASNLSAVGDYLAKAAITVLVYTTTRSPAIAATAFAISFLPWIVGGPVLAALAGHYPYRSVMVICDVVRLVLIGLVAIPGLPTVLVLLLLFAAAMFTPMSQAARSALLPDLIGGDRYVLGLSLQLTTLQVSQIIGYALGGAFAAYNAHLAIVADAATFGLSAVLLLTGVRHRPAVLRGGAGTEVMRETVAGFRLVFGHPSLRSIALIVFICAALGIIPEGMAAVWTAHKHAGGTGQSLIMAASPVGVVAGSVALVRAIRPATRRALIRPLAVLTALALIAAFFDPPLPGVVAISLVCGIALAGVVPTSNGLFVQVIPAELRSRTFGVMQGGLQVSNAVSIFGTGAAVQWLGLPLAIGLVGAVGGLVLAVCAIAPWRSAPPGGPFSDPALADAARYAAALVDVAVPDAHATGPYK